MSGWSHVRELERLHVRESSRLMLKLKERRC